MADSFCSLIGQGSILIACAETLLQRGLSIRGIISDCEKVSEWCLHQGVTRIDTSEDQIEFLSRESFDYLFSIVHHKLVKPEVLALAKKASVNFHDSPLPRYAGFNATSWAILDGCTDHGITWHFMSDEADSGDILLAEAIPITEDDTAFTLSTKCAEAATRTFGTLVSELIAGAVIARPQNPPELFHRRSERPGVGLLDWRQKASTLHRLVRGLDFGPDESWMTTPKLRTPSGQYLRVGTAAMVSETSKDGPGTISYVRSNELGVQAADGMLVLSDLTTLSGEPVVDEALRAFGLEQGAKLLDSPRDGEDAEAVLDRRVTGHERFWLGRLDEFVPTKLNVIVRTGSEANIGILHVELPEMAEDSTSTIRSASLLAALGVYLARVGEDANPVRLGLLNPTLSKETATLFSAVTPLEVLIDEEQSWSDVSILAAAELARQDQKGTYALDISLRYPSLREDKTFEIDRPILVSQGGVPGSLPQGSQICFCLDQERLTIVYDKAALSESSLQSLAQRIVHILAQGLDNGNSIIGALSLLPEAERILLLDTWQETKAPYASDKCVHQFFEEQVQRTPDKTALIFRSQEISYEELNRRANAVAACLTSKGVGPDKLVGVCVERSLDMVVSLLGVLKAGGAYVPLDPAYPMDRLHVMLEDSKAEIVVSQRHLGSRLPAHINEIIFVEDCDSSADEYPANQVGASNLAYVIFTSGSTGRPKGVMVEHRNVANFFAGMDQSIGTEPGVWLAVTSISFDISVLEIFWTLARGFSVVIQEESDRASLAQGGTVHATAKPMDFSLFYFSSQTKEQKGTDPYRVLLEGAKFADEHNFTAVWTPERHFHAFGGIYPNPVVTTAALATLTKNIALRAGSVVLPLHDPIRVAEDWAVIDNLSQGRVGLSFASGWHVNDFALMPGNFEKRREIMLESIGTIRKLWRGESITVKNGQGKDIDVSVFPSPIQTKPPIWIATAGNTDTFRAAGTNGFNILTNMLGQDISALKKNFAAYREARKEAGYSDDGSISVMLHTFVCDDDDEARSLAKAPFCDYMASSYDLVKVAPWMFPAYKQPSSKNGGAFDAANFDAEDQAALLDHAFDRYFDTAGLFGSPERALKMVEELKAAGATEICCLVDFGVDSDVVLENLPYLDRLRRLSNPRPVLAADDGADYSLGAQIERHEVTHLQCTPSMARIVIAGGALAQMGRLKKLLLGGEALPSDLATTLTKDLSGDLINMYGPTETTIWSTTSQVLGEGAAITIGRPIANTTIRILGSAQQLLPIGEAGELCIGGAGVVRGYWGQPEMTQARFIDDPFASGERLYRTGDLARFKESGELEFFGRLDQQVKLNGYRIEMGEIESVMNKYPAVRDSVVVVRDDEGPAQLVAYVVASGGKESGQGETADEHVASWEKQWSSAYQQGVGAQQGESRFDTSGWLNSFTGEPIAYEQMRRWLESTRERIVDLAPRRVLEIGCGTGMVLYACLDHVEHYTGVEISASALKNIERELSPKERKKVTLVNRPAHEIGRVELGAVDLVVINSVAQYFPDEDYFMSVLKAASEVVSEGGKIFLGDLRSLEHLRLFHTDVELHQAPGHSDAKALQKRIDQRVSLESELLFSQQFFQKVESTLPRIYLESVQLKRGDAENEMSLFRYDVVLSVGSSPAVSLELPTPRLECVDLEVLASKLEERPPVLYLQGVLNKRLGARVGVMEAIERGESNAETLRQSLALSGSAGMAPEELYSLNPAYDVEVRFGKKVGSLDAVFRLKEAGVSGRWSIASQGKEAFVLANIPSQGDAVQSLVPALRRHLKEFLPEYMVPASYVLLEQLPLTPNGKIDRKVLPPPHQISVKSTSEYVMPGNELEKIIASIWQEMLGVDRVGTRDNIFDLGASSMLTVEVNSRLSEAMGRKVPLVNMFRYPTIAALAAHLGADMSPAKKIEEERAESQAGRRKSAAERRRRARAQLSN